MMMFPNASKGYMPFCPSYDERKKAHDRRSRHRSSEDKKRRASNSDSRKTHSTPTLTQNKVEKADLRFMSVPNNLDLSRLHELWEDEDDKVKSESSVLKSFLGFFKKSKSDKVRSEPIAISRKRTDSEKENLSSSLKPRLESIREEDENVDTSNSSVVSSGSSTTCKSTSSNTSITKPMAAMRRHRTAMTALGTSPTSEAPAKKCATHLPEDDLDIKSTTSIVSQEDCLKSQSDCSTSSSSIEKQG